PLPGSAGVNSRPCRPRRPRAHFDELPTRLSNRRTIQWGDRPGEIVKLGTRVALSLGPVAGLALAAGALGWLGSGGGAAGLVALALGLLAVALAAGLGRALVEVVRTAIVQVRDALTVIASSSG